MDGGVELNIGAQGPKTQIEEVPEAEASFVVASSSCVVVVVRDRSRVRKQDGEGGHQVLIASL